MEATTGVLTPELKEALRQHKPALMELLREQQAKVINNVYCFDCFKTYGKQARPQPHRVAVSQDQPGWLELTCTRCWSKCYMRPPLSAT